MRTRLGENRKESSFDSQKSSISGCRKIKRPSLKRRNGRKQSKSRISQSFFTDFKGQKQQISRVKKQEATQKCKDLRSAEDRCSSKLARETTHLTTLASGKLQLLSRRKRWKNKLGIWKITFHKEQLRGTKCKSRPLLLSAVVVDEDVVKS